MFKKIKLSRTMCYGACPVYSVEILPSGDVFYNGEFYVEKMGRHQWKISESQVEQLDKLIKRFNFKHFQYETEPFHATDLPSCFTEIVFADGTKKKIDHYLGDTVRFDRKKHRMKLETFENKIDGIVGTEKYVGNT